jgi:transcriptional regulator with XRE-family HTH domain
MAKIYTNPLGASDCDGSDLAVEQTLGEFLRDWREANGMSQKEVGDKIGTDGQSISNLELGITKTMQNKNLRALATLTEMPIDAILAMVRHARSSPAKGQVQIPVSIKNSVVERAKELGISPDEWATAAIEAILGIEGWRPGTKIR